MLAITYLDAAGMACAVASPKGYETSGLVQYLLEEYIERKFLHYPIETDVLYLNRLKI